MLLFIYDAPRRKIWLFYSIHIPERLNSDLLKSKSEFHKEVFPVNKFKKIFLFFVGVVFMAYDEAEKSIEEAIQAVEEQQGGKRANTTKASQT